MTIQEFLAEQGLTAEEIAAITGNEKQSKAMTAALEKYTEGLTKHTEGTAALTRAEQDKKEALDLYNKSAKEVTDALAAQDAIKNSAAKAEAERARVVAYMKGLKDRGYDVPDEYIGVTPTVVESKPEDKFLTRDEWDKKTRAIAPDLVTLTSLSNEYQYLTGQPYIGINDDFLEAQKANKPLSEYVRTKYDFAGKRTAMQQKADQERLDKYAAEKVSEAEKKWQEQHDTARGTGAPAVSKFDKLAKTQHVDPKSWASPEGKRANRENRRKLFENRLPN